MIKITHNKIRMTAKRQAVILAAMYHAHKLGIAECESFRIRIAFRKGFAKRENILANCGPEQSRLIVINIDADLPDYVLQNTIAHEMVHAKQWIKAELSQTRSGYMKWMGKKVSAKLAYHETPWEHEAMTNEVIMAHSFVEFLNCKDM
jgi:hypothetical protein